MTVRLLRLRAVDRRVEVQPGPGQDLVLVQEVLPDLVQRVRKRLPKQVVMKAQRTTPERLHDPARAQNHDHHHPPQWQQKRRRKNHPRRKTIRNDKTIIYPLLLCSRLF